VPVDDAVAAESARLRVLLHASGERMPVTDSLDRGDRGCARGARRHTGRRLPRTRRPERDQGVSTSPGERGRNGLEVSRASCPSTAAGSPSRSSPARRSPRSASRR
jgi:hypothetical protein